MKNLFLCLASSLILGCQTAPTLKLMEERADYDKEARVSLNLSSQEQTRRPGMAVVYVHAHETAQSGYFHGGFLTIKLHEDSWAEADESLEAPSPETRVKK